MLINSEAVAVMKLSPANPPSALPLIDYLFLLSTYLLNVLYTDVGASSSGWSIVTIAQSIVALVNKEISPWQEWRRVLFLQEYTLCKFIVLNICYMFPVHSVMLLSIAAICRTLSHVMPKKLTLKSRL